MHSVASADSKNQVLNFDNSEIFSAATQVTSFLQNCTIETALEISAIAVLEVGRKAESIVAELKKPKLINQFLEDVGLTRLEINKYIKASKAFERDSENKIVNLGASLIFGLSAPKHEDLRDFISHLNGINQVGVGELKKRLVPTPKEKPDRKEIEWLPNRRGGGRKLKINAELQATSLQEKPGVAEWFEKRCSQSDLHGALADLQKELSEIEYLRSEVERLESMLAEKPINTATAPKSVDVEPELGIQSELADDLITTPDILYVEPELEMQEEQAEDLPIEPALQEFTSNDIKYELKLADREREVGEFVKLSFFGKLDKDLVDWCGDDLLKISEAYGKVNAQTLFIERSSDRTVYPHLCQSSWLIDDPNFETYVASRVNKAGNLYNSLLNKAKDFKKFLIDSDDNGDYKKSDYKEKSRRRFGKINEWAVEQKLYFDRHALLIGRLVLIPGGKDWIEGWMPSETNAVTQINLNI